MAKEKIRTGILSYTYRFDSKHVLSIRFDIKDSKAFRFDVNDTPSLRSKG